MGTPASNRIGCQTEPLYPSVPPDLSYLAIGHTVEHHDLARLYSTAS